MSVELKELIEKQGKVFEEFKEANDRRLAEIEGKNYADPLLFNRTEKLNEELGALQKSIDKIERKLSLPPDPENGTYGDPDVAAHKEAFQEFLRKGVTADLEDLQAKALNLGTDADGGYAVPEQLDRSILTLMKEYSPMRQVCSSMTIGGAQYRKLVDLGGATSGWVGETAARPETDTPKFAEITPVMGEIYANPAATQKMLDDVFFDAEGWLATSVAEEFAKREALAFLSGDGTNKPKGILNYPSAAKNDGARAFGTLEHLVTAAGAAITGDELISLVYSLKQGHRNGARWMMNRASVAMLRKQKDADGNYLWQPGLQLGQPATLLGYGIVENEDMADVAASAIAVMFGNFARAYLVVDRIGIRTLRDPYTNKPYVHFYSTKRVGGMLQDSEAIKLLKQGA